MRFQITMNMPSRAGNAVHQIIGEHPAASLNDFVTAMSGADFIVVEELYKDGDAGKHLGDYYSVGTIALNPMFIGKVKALKGGAMAA